MYGGGWSIRVIVGNSVVVGIDRVNVFGIEDSDDFIGFGIHFE